MGINGPASYTQVTPGAVPSGGQVIDAVGFGLKLFDHVLYGVTDTGQFAIEAIPVTPTVVPAAGAPIGNSAGPQYRLRWIARVTAAVGGQNQTAGTEAVAATDLSSQRVRLMAFGPK